MPALRILETDILQASKLDYFKHLIFFLSQLKQIINLISWNIFHLLQIYLSSYHSAQGSVSFFISALEEAFSVCMNISYNC